MSKLSKLKIQKLQEAQQIQKLENQLRQGKKRFKNQRKVFEQVLNGELKAEQLEIGSGLWTLATILKKFNNAERALYQPLFSKIFTLFPKSKLEVLNQKAIHMIHKVIKCRWSWLRDLEKWRPQSRKAEKMILELIHHLFAKYPVPHFMNQAWLELDSAMIQWFIHIGHGGNIRKAPVLPIKLTKKMAHYCLQGQSSLSITQALRRGQVLGLGGNKKLTRKILNSRIGKHLDYEDFWPTLIQFLIKHQEETELPVYEIVEYVHLQKYGLPEEEKYGNVKLPAEDPDFQIKGRSLSNLVKTVQDRFQFKKILKIFFQAPPVQSLIWQDQQEDPQEIIRIEPISNNFDLLTEGKVMKHCVATYLASCLGGNTSIWSMTKQLKGSTPQRLLTIELVISDDTRKVCQARGKCNREPKSGEMKFVKQWANDNQLTLDLC